MKKNHIQKIWLFLRHLFYNTPAVIVIFILIMAVIAGYLVYSKETTGISVTDGQGDHQESRQTRNNPADAKKENREITDSKPGEKKKQATLTWGWESDSDEHEEEFKNAVLETLPVTDIRVERPGIISFHAPPGSRDERKEVMEEIAILYRDTVGYDQPVAVGFFISGRPVEIYHFFRD